MRDPYWYPDIEVLKNLGGGVRDEQALKDMEADYATFRLSEIVFDDSIEQFGFKDLCTMHYRIFQDFYEWAGKPRINVSVIRHRYEQVFRPVYQKLMEQGMQNRNYGCETPERRNR